MSVVANIRSRVDARFGSPEFLGHLLNEMNRRGIRKSIRNVTEWRDTTGAAEAYTNYVLHKLLAHRERKSAFWLERIDCLKEAAERFSVAYDLKEKALEYKKTALEIANTINYDR